ncbi:hypothetical protein [Dawidia soli]|uniref:Uncharacterized protein n=1 Tax=Dawidia soli TaxID=2782352 RepID=A0AAP2DH96_9BACT|nr:hypothetical protein [Dawidia soli]MBT1690655.1 hypothetical protein [Dawidia soli]
MNRSEQENIHPKMSIEWLRTFEGFENFTDKEAEAALETIRAFSKVIIGVRDETIIRTGDQYEKP